MKRMCSWTRDDIAKKPRKLEKLLRKPRYYCEKCARASREKDTICHPRRMEKR